MVDNLPLVFTLIVTLAFSNIITSTVGLVLGNQLAKITTMPTTILAPIILVLTSVGAFAYRMNMGDVLVAMLFGLLGYMMIKVDFSRIPVVIALVLGPLAEQSFHTSLDISDGSYAIFFTRPYSLILIVLIVLGLAFPFLQTYRKRKTRTKTQVEAFKASQRSQSEHGN